MIRFRLLVRSPLLRALALPVLAVAAVGACDDDGSPSPIAPGPEDEQQVLVLNSTGQTLARYEVGEEISPTAQPVDLGATFDGTSMDANEDFAVTSVSSFGGSQVLFVDLDTDAVLPVDFLPPNEQSANPSRPGLDAAGVAWFAGRDTDAVYRAAPGEQTALLVADDVGTFVEAVLPVGSEFAAIDAFLDDDGGTFEPLGPSHVYVLDEIGAVIDEIDLPGDAVNALGGVVVDDRVVVLLGGTLDPNTFAPQNDGGLVVVDVPGRSADGFVPLLGNGVAIEVGADGLVYVTSTSDFVETSLTSFDPESGAFVAGPGDPIDTRDAGGAAVDCWTVTALEDGRLLCVTFDVTENGRFLLLSEDGEALDEVEAGFGTTDIHLQ